MRLRSGITMVYVDAKEVRRRRDRTRLSFPSLVAGVRSMSKEAIRQFRELLLIEWSTEVFHFAPEFSDFLRMARLRKEVTENKYGISIVVTPVGLVSKGPHLDKVAQIERANSQFPEYEEVKEKLDKYAKRQLLIFCGDLDIPVCYCTAKKEDIVPKLMDYLEGRHAMTVELLAEKEQSSKGKKRRRESTKNPSLASVSSKGSTKSRKKTKTASQKTEKKNVHESEDESEQEEDADEEEPEKETANDVPAEPMSDQGESDEENESEDKLCPSDDELCAAIGEILREVDIHTTWCLFVCLQTNYTAIVERLSKRFGTDLTPRKSHIMIMVGFQLIELSDDDDEE